MEEPSQIQQEKAAPEDVPDAEPENVSENQNRQQMLRKPGRRLLQMKRLYRQNRRGWFMEMKIYRIKMRLCL